MNAPLSSATLIGSGKAKELAALAAAEDADTVVFLNPLSLGQANRLAALTHCRILSVDGHGATP